MLSAIVRCVVALAFLLALPAGGLRADDPEVERIVDQWSKAPAIQSGRLKGLHLTLHSHTPDELIRPVGAPTLTPQEEDKSDAALKRSLTATDFEKFFAEVILKLPAGPDGLQVMNRNVTNWMAKSGRKNGQQIEFTCSQLSVVQEGRDLKNDEQYLGNRSVRSNRGKRSAWYDSSMSMGGVTGDDKPAAGAAEEPMSIQPWMFAIDSLRYWAASEPEILKQLKQMKLAATENGQESRLVGPHGEITFDTASGFVRRVGGASEPANPHSAEFRFDRPKQAGGGVELATAYAHVHYTNTKKGEARLTTADVFIVQSVEINVKIAPGEFVVPVPRGTLIRNASDFVEFDPSPHPPHPTREFRAKKDVPDLFTVVFPAGR